MGSDFFWFLDAVVIAAAAAMIFRGAKRGGVAVLISAAAAIVAFIAAFIGCTPISDKIYDSFIRSKVEEYMSERLGNAVDSEMISGLSQTDMMKTKLGDIYLSDLKIEYDDKNTAMIDLSSADLTETGIQNADLTGFGISRTFDWSLVKAGHITVTASEVKKYGIGNIVLSRIIASNMASADVFRAFSDVGNKLADTISPSLRDLGKDLADGSTDAVYTFVVSIITMAGGTVGERIMDDVITPTVMFPLKAVVFFLIFAIVVLILSLIANASKIINKIPIVSSVNGVVGAVLGLAEALITLMLICVVIRFVISVWGNSLVFINEQTISRTFLFRHLYAFDPLTLLGK
ncbi:MAG: CvpA family protein [Ruminiclostridium sp.]|nr:CvpA family protein [Ruminiclostridium sp.]